MATDKPRWPLELGLYLAVALLSSAWVLHVGRQQGGTFDEAFHLDQGLQSWRHGSNKPLMTAGAMPLPMDAQALPVYLWERYEGRTFRADQFPGSDFAEVIPVARAANLAFWWLLLAYAWRWGRIVGGDWGGRFALLYFACEPNLLAHASLATTDIPALTTTLIACYHGYRANLGARGPNQCDWLHRILIPALAYGVALCTKASALAFVPMLFVLFAIRQWPRDTWRFPAIWRATKTLAGDLVPIGLIGLAFAFAYVGSDWGTESTFITWADSLEDGPLKSVMATVSRKLTIFPNAGEALVQQIKHNFRGHGAYLMGRYYERSVWYYFPVALTVKLPVVTLALLAVVLATRFRSVRNPAAMAALWLLVFSVNCRVQIGIRLLFPLVAFLYLWLATAWPVPTRFNLFVRALGVLGLLAASAGVGTQGLRYTNELWGGLERGREVLADSNYDWGQGLPELARWRADHGDEPLRVWYYGADPAIWAAPFMHEPVHMWPERGDALKARLIRDTRGGLFAVSVSLLDACPERRRPELLELLAWLKTQPTVGQTGTFQIYRLTPGA